MSPLFVHWGIYEKNSSRFCGDDIGFDRHACASRFDYFQRNGIVKPRKHYHV